MNEIIHNNEEIINELEEILAEVRVILVRFEELRASQERDRLAALLEKLEEHKDEAKR